MKIFVAGGAGFVGGHMVHRLLRASENSVVVYDNFSSGRLWHLPENVPSHRLLIVKDDVKELPALCDAMSGCDLVIHFASNPDIAKAATDPTVDFWEGTYLTQNVLEAMRKTGTRQLLYASGSGVYGDTGLKPVVETMGDMKPISSYGASKIAGEMLISAYSHMFGLNGVAFRFANVVGSRQTHGVAYDFVRRLLKDPSRLAIQGNGKQSKSYIHVDDVLDAMLMFSKYDRGYDYFNVATEDYVTVHEIADLVVSRLKLNNVQYEFAGGDRGWKGDVPNVRFDCSKIRQLGWRNRRTSVQALQDAIDSLIVDAKSGKFDVEVTA